MADTTHSMDRPQLKENAKTEYSKTSHDYALRKPQPESQNSCSAEAANSGYRAFTHGNTPSQVVLAHCMPRQDKDSRSHDMPISQPRPPSSSGHPFTSNRPPSSSARRQHSRQEMGNISSEDVPDRPPTRPPSSFSKYQPLPAIGAPISNDKMDTSSNNHLTRSSTLTKQHSSNQLQHETNSKKRPDSKITEISKNPFQKMEMSSKLDNSILSRKTANPVNKSAEVIARVESIERLDLTRLDKPDGEWKIKIQQGSPHSNKPKGNSRHNSTKDTTDLYDGDDDDSDSTKSPSSKHGTSNIMLHNPTKTAGKKPVVIPSPDCTPVKEILLAVKLPTDGTRHQKYFNGIESLQSIVEFAEEMAGCTFAGYVLVVASPPNNVFVDLEDTIENAGLEDKTVFHLEEYDWTD